MIIKTVLTIIASLVLAASCSPGTESNVSEVDDVNRWDSMSTEEKDLFLSTFPSSTAGLSESERLALLERFDAVVGTPLDRSAESRVEISLEEAILAQVKEFEALYASNPDCSGLIKPDAN